MEPLYTIVQFIFISCPYSINPKKFKYKFDTKEEEYELDDNNCVVFLPRSSKPIIYYCETIQILYEGRIIISFDFLIYVKKKNTAIIDLEEKNKPSFELFFYTKDAKFNPTCLKYKGKEYVQFETYGNKYRRRIFFANVNPEKLEYINSEKMNEYKFKFENNNTYHALFRIFDYNKFEITISNMTSYYGDLEEEKKEISRTQLDNLEKMLIDFNNKFFEYINLDSSLIEQRNKAYSFLETSAKEIADHDLYDLMDKPEICKYENYSEKIFYLLYLDFCLGLFNEIAADGKKNCQYTRTKISKFLDMEKTLYYQLKMDENLNMEQKINILRTVTIFLRKSLCTTKKIFNLDYININIISKESPYLKSNRMLKNIITEITEDSRLFEAFLYFDSQVIQNILLKNTEKDCNYIDKFGKNIQVKQPEFVTEYGMSLMTVEEIKQHLLNLLPTIIIRIDSNISIRALYEKKTKLMVFNELQMFGESFTENEELFKEEADHYIVPISMEIFHGNLSHGKLRYNNGDEFSPLVLRDSKYNFKIQKIMKRIKLDFNEEKIINNGETGRVFEHYISENKNIIHKLKSRTTNLDIINCKYWTDKNFNSLYKAINCDEENNNLKFQEEIILDDYDDESEGNYDCVFD